MILDKDQLITFAKEYKEVEAARGQVEFTEPHYFRKSLGIIDNSVEVVLVCFADLQSTSVHDHTGSSCAVVCLAGQLTEHIYFRNTQGDLATYGMRQINVGDIHYVDSKLFHQVANMSCKGSVLLNFYSPPLTPLPEKTVAEAK
jgi:predicted metal-dependent enzyme (double-stranded beta helix superfamily)